MQMDSKSARQDDGDDTSNWKSVATPKILTTGLGSVSTQKSPKLGGALSIVQRKPIELNWWKDFASTKNGSSLQNSVEGKPDIIIHCDASDLGWGISSQQMEISGRWTNKEQNTSINVRELKTILFALKMHAKNYRGKNIKGGQLLHPFRKLEGIVHNLIDNVSNNIVNDSDQSLRLVASCKIAALIEEDATFNTTNRILLAVRNMVEVLPHFVIEDGPQETELITRYLQAALVPLFENIDKHILFRWTSISDNDKVIMLRPDASINIVYGAALDQRLGCGEVKSQYQALNHRLTGLDLIRVARLANTASDKYKAIATFAFIVVGNHATFYVLHRAKANIYTMSEVEHIQLALKLADIPLFIAQSSKIAKIISSFERVLNCGTHHYDDHPPTLTDHMLLQAINSKTSRKRKSISSYYNH